MSSQVKSHMGRNHASVVGLRDRVAIPGIIQTLLILPPYTKPRERNRTV